MSKDIYVNVQAVGAPSPRVSNVYMQLDHIPVAEMLYYEGVSPVERYMAYPLSTYDIRQKDILTDTKNIDPQTSTNYQYRVINIPEPFDDGHMEIVADLIRGSASAGGG